MSEIVQPTDPRVDAFIARQSSYAADTVGVWSISQSNDRQLIRIGSLVGTYREAVAAMLSDPRAHWYAWGNGSVHQELYAPMSYTQYVENVQVTQRKAQLEAELARLNRM